MVKVSNIETGSEKELPIKLRPGEKFLFGRSSECDIALPDLKLSRKHFSISWDGKKILVLDENSSNGTFLNGMPLKLTQIFNIGDFIEAGIHKFEVLQVSNVKS